MLVFCSLVAFHQVSVVTGALTFDIPDSRIRVRNQKLQQNFDSWLSLAATTVCSYMSSRVSSADDTSAHFLSYIRTTKKVYV